MHDAIGYQALGGERHRHGETIHSHPHGGPHTHGDEDHHDHGHGHGHGHGHSHGLIDPSIKRSRAGLRAVRLSLAPEHPDNRRISLRIGYKGGDSESGAKPLLMRDLSDGRVARSIAPRRSAVRIRLAPSPGRLLL
jgi:hypothetical protein